MLVHARQLARHLFVNHHLNKLCKTGHIKFHYLVFTFQRLSQAHFKLQFPVSGQACGKSSLFWLSIMVQFLLVQSTTSITLMWNRSNDRDTNRSGLVVKLTASKRQEDITSVKKSTRQINEFPSLFLFSVHINGRLLILFINLLLINL